MKTNKGFTLIELLAVIIILGILMIIAIPSVTRYISDSRKSSYVNTAKEIIGGARNLVNEGKLGMYDTEVTYYIPSSFIKTEGGEAKSPYGKLDEAYVAITYDGKGYSYYWISRDETGQGIDQLVSNNKLNEDNIVSDITDDYVNNLVKTNTIGCRNNIKILNDNGTWDNYSASSYTVEDAIYNKEYMCPNCVFTRPTSSLTEGNTININTTDDYRQIENYKTSPFIGVYLSNNVIKKLYVCAVKDDKLICLNNAEDKFDCYNSIMTDFLNMEKPADLNDYGEGKCDSYYYTVPSQHLSDLAYTCESSESGYTMDNSLNYISSIIINNKRCYVIKSSDHINYTARCDNI